MNNGLKIILERMKTNPEDFRFGRNGRWAMLVEDWWFLLTDEEREIYRQAIREVLLPEFERKVLEELVLDDDRRNVDYRRRMRMASSSDFNVGTQLPLPLVFHDEGKTITVKGEE